jgi:hypothetical protein
MKRVFASIAVAGAVFLMIASQSFADSLSSVFGTPEKDSFNLIHVQDLARLLHDSNVHLYVYDANPPDVREATGIIPGARLLGSDDEYDVAKELPPDKNAKLVFYCHNLH